MGWNSYDFYDTTVTEAEVKANADVMAEKLKDYGWQYIVVDIQWYALKAGTQREKFQYIPFTDVAIDEYSRLLPDPERFPSSAGGQGFKPLADYVHSLGLKFGIHIMRGIPRIAAHLHMKIKGTDATADQAANPTSICPWNPDMYGLLDSPLGQAYYDSLIELYASWGVDFIKCDDISFTSMYPDHFAGRHEIEMLHAAIEKCGRPIVLSLSPGPALIEKAWNYEQNANMWRITDDFWDNWDALKNMFWRCELWQSHVKPGCYPDCDMLPIGKLFRGFGKERDTYFTYEEAKTMMTLWCVFGSPLMMGGELTMLDEQTTSLLTNRELLSLLDPTRTRRQLARDDDHAVWMNAKGGSVYLALFNFKNEEAEVCADLSDIPEITSVTGDIFAMTELWTGEQLSGCLQMKVQVPAHGCRIYRLY